MQKLTPEALTAWAVRAAPGDTAVYCRAPVSPAADIAAHALTLREAGLITLTRKREGKDFRFIAQRLRVDPAAVAPRLVNRGQFGQRVGRDCGSATRRASENAIYRALVRAANRGEPCPTNAELARWAGLSGAVAASYRVRRLVAAGRIAIWEPSPVERRVVTIIASGKATPRCPIGCRQSSKRRGGR
ncbi:MAG: hypothetical protein U5M50_04080 [Sphingobium sp.]|nr:hypothetical protein [Sphingobium sp.]